MKNETQIAKWGNSLALRIPAYIAKQAGLEEGVSVSLNYTNENLVVKKSKRLKLSDLLKRVNKENLHQEIFAGKKVGNEFW